MLFDIFTAGHHYFTITLFSNCTVMCSYIKKYNTYNLLVCCCSSYLVICKTVLFPVFSSPIQSTGRAITLLWVLAVASTIIKVFKGLYLHNAWKDLFETLTHCRLNELPHTIYRKILISILGMSDDLFLILREKNG